MTRTYVDRLPLAMTRSMNQSRGEWYVCRSMPRFGEEDSQHYLHSDGVWRRSTYSGDNYEKPTGYFATEDDAKAALAAKQ